MTPESQLPFCVLCRLNNCCHVRRQPPRLSPREYQVAARISKDGAPNKTVAHDLGLTEGSLKVKLYRMYQKLRLHYPEVNNRAALVAWFNKIPPEEVID